MRVLDTDEKSFELYKALEYAIEDLNKIHRKESVDYLQEIKEKLK